jgi:hypothetical protein
VDIPVQTFLINFLVNAPSKVRESGVTLRAASTSTTSDRKVTPSPLGLHKMRRPDGLMVLLLFKLDLDVRRA